jgi:hypothetical protein
MKLFLQLLMAPVMGLAFVVFLPFVGFVLVTAAIADQMLRAAHKRR